ncbi:PKD domain-containing protein [Micropruina sp.]|uniref:PKD domain-containing protein n=1 Tax=Micropruina sp. TaxID=2737536 RepID=UPI0039E2773E
MTGISVRTRGSRALAVLAGLLVAIAVVAPPTAKADSDPVDPSNSTTPPTVAIDRLPTVQHNGVAWNQVIVSNVVYVVGSFTAARPAGAASGTNLTTRNNALAYNLTTGELITTWNPNLNGQALAIAAAPDGSRIYVGGDFTTVGGTSKSRIAALDPTTGALISSFTARVDGTVRAIAATASTVYAGGSFSTVNGVSRARLAAIRASDGALLTAFAPTLTTLDTSSPKVHALVLSPTGDRLVVGGNFGALNGSSQPGYGLGMLNSTTGASLALPANDTVRDAGKDSAILSLSSDGTYFYGTGYIYGTGGNLEGAFSARWADGGINWVEDCHGDSYGVYSSPTAVYVVGHPHYCLNLGGYGETSTPQRALAFSRAATGTLTKDTRGYPSFTGVAAPSLQNFFPQLTTGSVSGQGQAAWTVTGSGDYVVLAGEFGQVNGTAQQGLVRLANKAISLNQQGPKASGTNLTPTLTSPAAGQVKLAWTANYDYDNTRLTYSILRDATSNVVATLTGDSTWWSRPSLSYTDSGVAAGTHTYWVKAADSFGNSQTSPSASITVTSSTNASPTASFTATVSSSTVSVSAAASTDSDGSIASYAWNWGDSSTGSGVTATHTYAAAGTYSVTLTVTDDQGATATSTMSVAVGTSTSVLADDAFTRTVTSGWGTASTGGAWTVSGTGFSTDGSTGLLTLSSSGVTRVAALAGISSTSSDLTSTIQLDKLPSASAGWIGLIGRRVGSADYRLKVRFDTGGTLALYLVSVSGTETTLASATVSGVTYTANAKLNVRLQVTGTSPTTLWARAWLSTASEPSAWQVSTTDSTAALQAAGSVGVHGYMSTSATNSPWTIRFDDFKVVPA